MLVQIRYSKQIGIWKFNNTKTNYEKRNEIKHKYIWLQKRKAQMSRVQRAEGAPARGWNRKAGQSWTLFRDTF